MPTLRVRKVDYAGIIAMARELARYSATTLEHVLMIETASIIKICALRAHIASAAAIRRQVKAEIESAGNKDTDAVGRVTINVTQSKGRTWYVRPGATPNRGPGGTFRLVYAAGRGAAWHLGPSEWAAYLLAIGQLKEYIRVRTEQLLARRGIQRLSWLQVADRMGVSLASVSPAGNLQEDIVRAARGPRGRVYQNGTASVSITPRGMSIQLRNESPLAVKNQGQADLDRAVQQRLNGFRTAVSKGVLDDLQLRAARWRGIFVRPR